MSAENEQPAADIPEAFNALNNLLRENALLRAKNDELIRENGELRVNGRTQARVEYAVKFEKKISAIIKTLEQLKQEKEAAL